MEKIYFTKEIKITESLGICENYDGENNSTVRVSKKHIDIGKKFIESIAYGKSLLNAFYRGYFDDDKMNLRTKPGEDKYRLFVDFCDYHAGVGFQENEYLYFKELNVEKNEKKKQKIEFYRSKVELLVKISEAIAS